MQDGQKTVWSIPYVSVTFFPSLKQNFIAYRYSKVSSCPDCFFEIHQLWQSGFSRVFSNSCWSCSFAPEIIKIGLSSHKMYSNNIEFLESTTILDACTKKVMKLIEWTMYIYIYIYIYIYKHTYYYHHHVTLLAWVSLNISCHLSLSTITPERYSRLHPVLAQSDCIYIYSCWLSCLCLSTSRGSHEYIVNEFVLTFPAVSHMSDLSDLDSFCDG